ncbi:hypothetical protein ACFX10_009936 [Malus domestica]
MSLVRTNSFIKMREYLNKDFILSYVVPFTPSLAQLKLPDRNSNLHDDSSLVFPLGYYSDPSMRQLHPHVISQDFDSTHLKNKKHWNSFNTAFFRHSMDAAEEVTSDGKAKLKDDDNLLSMELRCHRCRSAHPNIPRLKSHITNCRAPFPSTLLQNGRLVHAPSNVSIDP